MSNIEEQKFLNTLEKKLWTSANKLLPSLDASQYKHVMPGLVFLKYVSDAFDIRRDELRSQFTDHKHDYFLDPTDFKDRAKGIAYVRESQLARLKIIIRRQLNRIHFPDHFIEDTTESLTSKLAEISSKKEKEAENNKAL